MESFSDPPWPRQAGAALVHEVRAFLATEWAVTRSPRAFAASWAAGEREALNPIYCLLNALAILGPWHVLWAHLLGVGEDTSLWIQLLKPALPLVAACFLAGGAHAILRARGTRRKLRTSLGLTLFVQAGPVAVLGLAVRPLIDLMYLGRAGAVAPLANLAVVLVFCVYLVAMLSGAHRTTRRRAVLAVATTFVAWMVFWGLVNHAAPGMVRGLLA